MSELTTLDVIRLTRSYLDYIEEHIKNVNKAWDLIKDKCSDMRFIWDDFYFWNLDYAIKVHDFSKLYENEFIQYRKRFYPAEGEVFSDFEKAWEHHKGKNFHHWEKWTNEELTLNEWEIHCAHMVIDWMAMGFKFGDTAKEYYEKNKEKIILPDYAVKFIYEIFKRLEN